MSGDSIYMATLHSWHGLQRIAEDAEEQGRYYGSIQHYMDASDVAWLIECLKVMGDNDEYFPNGKWALIQQLQGQVYQAAKSAVHGEVIWA